MRILAFFALLSALPLSAQEPTSKPPERWNVLLLTSDDLNYDSLGFAGCPIPGISPNLDKLAASGMRFEQAFVTVAVCQPCRSVLMTGRYPHRNGAVGFNPIFPGVPTLPATLRAAGWRTGVMGKASHTPPLERDAWDMTGSANPKDPADFGREARAFFERAKKDGVPFYLNVNSHDPHRPFAGSAQESQKAAKGPKRKAGGRKGGAAKEEGGEEDAAGGQAAEPTRVYKPEEVPVPGFLPDLPDVRREVAQYFTSVHRGDETHGAVLKALDETGLADRTIVVYLSDHGMSFPFSKSNCYRTSNRTPLVVRWPGVVKPGAVEAAHMVSGIDLMPTLLDVLGVEAPPGMDGRSFVPLLRGEPQEGRDRVVTVYHRTSGDRDYLMRCVRTKTSAYIYNAWSDGKTDFKVEAMAGLSFAAMQASKDPAVKARVELFLHRVPEEFYDEAKDPDDLHNLIADPGRKGEIEEARKVLREWMEKTKDPLIGTYRTHLRKDGGN